MSTALPEVVLKEGVNWTNITFNGRGFAWVNHPENRAMIKAHHDERRGPSGCVRRLRCYEAELGDEHSLSAWVQSPPRARSTPAGRSQF